MTFRLFTYGCLLDPSYIGDLAPSARFVRIGWAKDWMLVFHYVGFIVPVRGATTFGALYDGVSEADILNLDWFEGMSYVRRTVAVTDDEDHTVDATAYAARWPLDWTMPPAKGYRDVVRRGYAARNAPPEAYGALEAAIARSA